MSKRMKRFSFSVLISLAVVAGVYTSVLGASLHAGITRGSLHVTAGLLPDLSQRRVNFLFESIEGLRSLNQLRLFLSIDCVG